MTTHLALIVDDEPDICELLELTLNRMDIDTLSAGDLKTAYQFLNVHNISICLTDMRLPDGNGIELVKKIQTQSKHIPVAMISAHGNMDTAIEALKAGAFDFVSKPLELAELRNLVNSAIKLADKNLPQNTLEQNTAAVQSDSTEKLIIEKKLLLGNSPAMQETNKMIVKLAKSQAPVYISGESGTGKELAAKQIHQMSSRSDQPFIPVNCGAIPSELMESEFFGHQKGSFTGANKDKQGLFQAASGGTLFLDEVADLPLSMQVKLLRAIQEKAIRPVGSQKEEKINVRIISATHKNLKQLVADGDFREDLYYRINVIELGMPPLRKRTDDIIILCNFFLDKLSFEDDYHLSTEAADLLKGYAFPGNVRELENILERAITLCDESIIQAHDLSLQEPIQKSIEMTEDTPSLLKTALSPLKDEQIIKQALEDTHCNRKAAAELLGVTYRQFRYSLKKLGLD
ncbi:MAG: sigma-54 dependent transcriptional regulator [gamma proteobacterium symbiont of Bathyaustriella thionipta]|nr:sigma-54 dependent transcriptional regulator [gamma proteobacterium symbiont of Bathyaustriella thionipta]MCU7950240.1 sigma-54 dependent transcriptional regulator [gamma proteobacterium symbiont of Bathyaustriella thionipta]MCU7953860.1 sigma-54 dependent transcriptional regulator [gamma proteobacterium symbiont of Bathyaustriella thionipta]MCU7956326.1 sigma-54 dependent transcriptional regulator [gamma proteobacterium symbiont of Bathyaustriella thionipta]MCU7966744.1 sigma-54 dependent t